MGTQTAIHVESKDIESFKQSIHAYLESSHPDEAITEKTDGSFSIYGELFRFVSDPTAFACAQWPAGWCTAYFNCFAKLEEFADSLSLSLNSQVVVLKVQTVSSCYYLSVHRDGHQVRAFDYEDCEQLLDFGSPLDFESADLPDPEKCGSDFYEYCEELGFIIGGMESEPDEWTEIKLVNQPEKDFSTSMQTTKPWWKRMLGG